MPSLYGLDKDSKGNLISLEPKVFLRGLLVRAVVAPIVTASGGMTFKLHDVQYLKDDGVRYGGAVDGADLLSKSEDLFDDLPELTSAETKETPKNESLAKAAANVL